jgi:hypothetical protein
MLATISNRLKKVTTKNAEKVMFNHTFRCPIEAWFEKTDTNKYGWTIAFFAPHPKLLEEFKSAIFKQSVSYIEQRAEKKITELSFEDIETLSGALNIKSFYNCQRKSY